MLGKGDFMKINFGSFGVVEDLKYLDEKQVALFKKHFGEPNRKGHDGIYGAFFFKHIGFLDKNNNFVKPSLLEKIFSAFAVEDKYRKVYFCKDKKGYWISLTYGWNEHLDFPNEAEKKG